MRHTVKPVNRRSRGRSLFVAVGAALLVATFALPATAVDAPPGVSMDGTGPQPKGLGMFSSAAMSQDHCAKNGRMDSYREGTGPWCVNPMKAGSSNGGATAEGVTADSVKV